MLSREAFIFSMSSICVSESSFCDGADCWGCEDRIADFVLLAWARVIAEEAKRMTPVTLTMRGLAGFTRFTQNQQPTYTVTVAAILQPGKETLTLYALQPDENAAFSLVC